MSHSPRPWTVQKLPAHPNYPNWVPYCVRSQQNVHLATVGHVDRHDEEKQEANARLMAAAPDLLAACKHFVAILDGYPQAEIWDEAIKEAKHAIDLTEGKV